VKKARKEAEGEEGKEGKEAEEGEESEESEEGGGRGSRRVAKNRLPENRKAPRRSTGSLPQTTLDRAPRGAPIRLKQGRNKADRKRGLAKTFDVGKKGSKPNLDAVARAYRRWKMSQTKERSKGESRFP
jgi:hypothetical protein